MFLLSNMLIYFFNKLYIFKKYDKCSVSSLKGLRVDRITLLIKLN